MLIQQPFIKTTATHTFLISHIKDEQNGTEKEIYFSVSNEYGKYLCDEVADAFVVAMLLPALVSGQDIKISAPVSEMLYFHIENALTYTLSKVFGKKTVHIFPDSLITPGFQTKAVATGFSGGVDSFATVMYHTSPECPGSLQLTHLTLFNVGAYGNRPEAGEAFLNDSRRAQEFAREINLPLVLLDSNMSLMQNQEDIFYFSTRFVNNIMAGALALQKLFNVYLLSSGVAAENLRVDARHRDQGYYDVLLANFLSGSSTRFIISGSNMNRMDKIKYITAGSEEQSAQSIEHGARREEQSAQSTGHGARSEEQQLNGTTVTKTGFSTEVGQPNAGLVQKHLYVCQADVYNEKYSMGFTRDTSPNCCECDKCTRTLLALELLGCINDFAHRFDLAKWAKVRPARIARDLVKYQTDPFARELIDLLHRQKLPVPLKSRYTAQKQQLHNRLASIKFLRTIHRVVIKRVKRSEQ